MISRQDAPFPQTLYRIPQELGKPVLLDAPLQIKHIAFARLMVRFIKWAAASACRLVSGHTNYFVDRRIDSYDTRSVASRSLSKEPAPPPLPTAAEIAILAVLWRQGASTVREVHEALGKDSGYTTTLKLMQLMFEKGLVVRNERYRSHLYEARAPKEQTQRQIAGDLLKRAFEGSAKSLVLGALAAQPASGKDLAEIRSLLDEFEKRRRKK
jgi:BlaI family transcriptional regulator, penicillinase repressor